MFFFLLERPFIVFTYVFRASPYSARVKVDWPIPIRCNHDDSHRFNLREALNLVGKENECRNFGGNHCFLFTLDLW